MKTRIYVDTSVIGGCDDDEFRDPSRVARVDVLMSWNFKHVVNLFRIHAFNSVNLRCGYPLLEIRAPREVVPDE